MFFDITAGGKALGVEGLWVADASVFPTSLGVNPQLSTLAVASFDGARFIVVFSCSSRSYPRESLRCPGATLSPRTKHVAARARRTGA